MSAAISESAVYYWSRLLATRFFESEQEARQEILAICERHSAQSWSTPAGLSTLAENRKFAGDLPLHQEDGQWKVGRPLAEYLSNMTSDFSDGTNGEPTGSPPSGGGAGSQVGLPDYKYLERKKSRHDKLKALMQRRDPEGLSSQPVDKEIRAYLGKERS